MAVMMSPSIQAILVVACSLSYALGQELEVGRARNERESLKSSSGGRQSTLSPPPAIIPSRQTSSKVVFRNDNHRENTINHIDSEFQKQKLPENTPQPYDFGYSIQDEYGNSQYRQETGHQGGIIRGSYGYTDALGTYRKVKYIADGNGFRAEVLSNEPGVKGENPASASFIVDVPRQTFQPAGFLSPPSSISKRSNVPRRFPSQRRFPSASVTSAVVSTAATLS
ncbi:uncharacterized protein LOC111272917 isoform X2 [Varroa jacobsoni]|uniref:uncharacterized protein LOC111272917 isoform X2 n=1 Tax=Varroa jacobsoni TaxID=62625 RepID=UPI000BF57A70|nr:uncharacterized protein LOC111272917 isoform X2 [Varroa jacobsoni]